MFLNRNGNSQQPPSTLSKTMLSETISRLDPPLPEGFGALPQKKISERTQPAEFRQFIFQYLQNQASPELQGANPWNIDPHRQRLAIILTWTPHTRWKQQSKSGQPQVLNMVKDVQDVVVLLEHSQWLLLKVPEDPGQPEAVVEQALLDAHNLVCQLSPGSGSLAVGVGTWHGEPGGTGHSLGEAYNAVTAAPWLQPDSRVHAFAADTHERLLEAMPQSQITQGHLTAVQRLTERDDWYQTVQEYFLFGRDVAKAAQRLGLHPNSVTYRLRQAGDSIGLDPLDYRQGSELHSAMILYDIQQQTSADTLWRRH